MKDETRESGPWEIGDELSMFLLPDVSIDDVEYFLACLMCAPSKGYEELPTDGDYYVVDLEGSSTPVGPTKKRKLACAIGSPTD